MRLGRFLGRGRSLVIQHTHRAGFTVPFHAIDAAANQHPVQRLGKNPLSFDYLPALLALACLHGRHVMKPPLDDLLLHPQRERRMTSKILFDLPLKFRNQKFVNRIGRC